MHLSLLTGRGWARVWSSKTRLTPEHTSQLREMLQRFDLVGLTERFDESLLLLARSAGLPYPQYRRMNEAGTLF